MLDIRATHYVSPLSEVEFESIPLTVHIVNVADETGLVTGKFRVYNDTTGLLIHTSDIAPLSMAAGAAVDVSALTDWDPPAPLDDTYFVVFDGRATNTLVPDGIGIFLGAFHFDVKPVGMGPAPAAHHGTHELGGSDEIDCTGLPGAGGSGSGTPSNIVSDETTFGITPDAGASDEYSRGDHTHGTPAGGGGGTSDHAALSHLAYADAGHTGFAPTSHDHAGNDLKFSKVHPAADAVNALQVLKADDSTPVLDVDTTNSRLGIGVAAPSHPLHVSADGGGSLNWIARFTNSWSGSGPQCGFVLSSPNGTHYKDRNWANNTNAYQHGDFCIFCSDGPTSDPSLLYPGVTISLSAQVGINIPVPTAQLDINGDTVRLRTTRTITNAGDSGNPGDICWDANYIYVCVAANTWKRTPLSTW